MYTQLFTMFMSDPLCVPYKKQASFAPCKTSMVTAKSIFYRVWGSKLSPHRRLLQYSRQVLENV